MKILQFALIAVALLGSFSAKAEEGNAGLEHYYVHGFGAQSMNNAIGLESGHWGSFKKTVKLGSIGSFRGQEISIGGITGEPHFNHHAIFSIDPSAPGVRVDDDSVSISLQGDDANRFYDALVGLTPRGNPAVKSIEYNLFKLRCDPENCNIWLSKNYSAYFQF